MTGYRVDEGLGLRGTLAKLQDAAKSGNAQARRALRAYQRGGKIALSWSDSGELTRAAVVGDGMLTRARSGRLEPSGWEIRSRSAWGRL